MPTIALPRAAGSARTRPASAARRYDPFEGPRWTALSAVTDGAVLWCAASAAVEVAPRGAFPAGATPLLALFAVITMLRLLGRGLYGERPGDPGLLDMALECGVAVAIGLGATLSLAAVITPDPAITGALVAQGVFAVGAVVISRGVLMLVRRAARARGMSGKRTLIVGAGWVGAELERRLLERPSLGLHPIGFLDADPAPAFHEMGAKGDVLGTPADLGRVAALTGAEHVVVAFGRAPDSEVLPIVRQGQQAGLEVSLVPRLFEHVSERQWVQHVGGFALCAMRTAHPRSWRYAIKHVAGRTAATAMMLLLAPVMLAVAIAVKLSSPGPVFFRQRRVGRDGQTFDILKFRTMKVETAADRAASDAGSRHLALVGPGGVEGNDRRTAIGTFLRRSSLDELPQLLNVVLGHMSIVGPRPERPEFVALFGESVRGYDDRHRVKSGITGWAQVNGLRGATSMQERIELDNWYVANWSLWLDVKILLLTPLEVLRSRAEKATGKAVASPS